MTTNHASRVLPGFHPDFQNSHAHAAERPGGDRGGRVRHGPGKEQGPGDLGITYGTDTLRLIDAFRGFGFPVGSVVLTRFSGQPAAGIFQVPAGGLGLKSTAITPLRIPL